MEDLISTEYRFKLKVGLRGPEGTLYREGTMRLATARDEIQTLRDHRVQANPSYQQVILLARTVTLDKLDAITPEIIEELFMTDFAQLQRLYIEINGLDDDDVAAADVDIGSARAGNV
jgi:hypothetical protein